MCAGGQDYIGVGLTMGFTGVLETVLYDTSLGDYQDIYCYYNVL